MTVDRNDVHDLDDLAAPPLLIAVAGKTYTIDVTVETMMAVDRAQREEGADQWALASKIMSEAGMDETVFRGLNVRQAQKLTELITERFFPGAAAEEAKPLSGPPPSPPSSDTSEGTPES